MIDLWDDVDFIWVGAICQIGLIFSYILGYKETNTSCQMTKLQVQIKI